MNSLFNKIKSFGGQLFAIVKKIDENGMINTFAFVGKTTENSNETKHAGLMCRVHIDESNINDAIKKIDEAIGGLRIQSNMLCIYANQQNKTYIATQIGKTANILNGQTNFLKQIAKIKPNTKPGDKIKKAINGPASNGSYDLQSYLMDAGFTVDRELGKTYFYDDISPDYILFSCTMSENTANTTLYYKEKGKTLIGIGVTFPEKIGDKITVNYGLCELKTDTFGKFYDEKEVAMPITTLTAENIQAIMETLDNKINEYQPTNKSIIACEIPGVFEVYGHYGDLSQLINPPENGIKCNDPEKTLAVKIVGKAIAQTKCDNYCILDRRNSISEKDAKELTEIHDTMGLKNPD